MKVVTMVELRMQLLEETVSHRRHGPVTCRYHLDPSRHRMGVGRHYSMVRCPACGSQPAQKLIGTRIGGFRGTRRIPACSVTAPMIQMAGA